MTKKKTELTTTRQIETRVKRQVVLEDGKVVGDSGPIVTTSTTEDTEKQEHQQKEVSDNKLENSHGLHPEVRFEHSRQKLQISVFYRNGIGGDFKNR